MYAYGSLRVISSSPRSCTSRQSSSSTLPSSLLFSTFSFLALSKSNIINTFRFSQDFYGKDDNSNIIITSVCSNTLPKTRKTLVYCSTPHRIARIAFAKNVGNIARGSSSCRTIVRRRKNSLNWLAYKSKINYLNLRHQTLSPKVCKS